MMTNLGVDDTPNRSKMQISYFFTKSIDSFLQKRGIYATHTNRPTQPHQKRRFPTGLDRKRGLGIKKAGQRLCDGLRLP
jgi:hypothetical protein